MSKQNKLLSGNFFCDFFHLLYASSTKSYYLFFSTNVLYLWLYKFSNFMKVGYGLFLESCGSVSGGFLCCFLNLLYASSTMSWCIFFSSIILSFLKNNKFFKIWFLAQKNKTKKMFCLFFLGHQDLLGTSSTTT